MSGERRPVQRIALPSAAHEMVDLKYSIKDFVDREQRGRDRARRLVLNFDIYRDLIDNARRLLADKLGGEVSADPAMIVQVILVTLSNEELLVRHLYEETDSAPTEEAEWVLIRETFAWRLLGRYNRELLREHSDERDGDDG